MTTRKGGRLLVLRVFLCVLSGLNSPGLLPGAFFSSAFVNYLTISILIFINIFSIGVPPFTFIYAWGKA